MERRLPGIRPLRIDTYGAIAPAAAVLCVGAEQEEFADSTGDMSELLTA